MTLREEIHEYVYQHNKDEYGKCHECEYRTEQILKLFEKMIDELYKNAYDDFEKAILEKLKEELEK